MRFKLILITILFTGCFTDPKSDGVVYKKGHEVKTSNELLFKFSNDTITQELKMILRGVNQFQFQLKTINSKTSCDKSIKGIAVNLLPDAPEETDLDENGISFPVEQYYFTNKGCELFFRIAKDKTKVQVVSNNCSDYNCTLSSIGLLRRVGQ